MDPYKLRLEFESDGVTAHTRIVVQDPLLAGGEPIGITPDCVLPSEIEHYVERMKYSLDEALRRAKHEFATHRK